MEGWLERRPWRQQALFPQVQLLPAHDLHWEAFSLFVNIKFAAGEEANSSPWRRIISSIMGPTLSWDLLTLRGAQFMGAGYDIPNIRGRGQTVCTNHVWGSPFRAYGSPQSLYSSELLMDELAEKIGMDPWEIRYKNCYRPGSTNPSGQEPEVFSYPEMLEAIKPRYEEAKERAKRESTDKIKKGVGLSMAVYGCGIDGPDSSEAWAVLNPDDTVTIVAAWEDHGQGADMGMVGTAHEALRPMGITPDRYGSPGPIRLRRPTRDLPADRASRC